MILSIAACAGLCAWISLFLCDVLFSLAEWDGSYLEQISSELFELEKLFQQYRELYLGTEPQQTQLFEREGLSQLPKSEPSAMKRMCAFVEFV